MTRLLVSIIIDKSGTRHDSSTRVVKKLVGRTSISTIQEVEVRVITRGVNSVVPVRVIWIIERAVHLSIKVRTGVDKVKIANLALDC